MYSERGRKHRVIIIILSNEIVTVSVRVSTTVDFEVRSRGDGISTSSDSVSKTNESFYSIDIVAYRVSRTWPVIKSRLGIDELNSLSKIKKFILFI